MLTWRVVSPQVKHRQAEAVSPPAATFIRPTTTSPLTPPLPHPRNSPREKRIRDLLMPSDDGTDLVEDFLGGPDPDPDTDPDVSALGAWGPYKGADKLRTRELGRMLCGRASLRVLERAPDTSHCQGPPKRPKLWRLRGGCRALLLLRTRLGRRTVGSKPRWSGTGPSRPSA
jgi:hypothetical protein